MARKRLALLVALILMVVVIAFGAGDWVGQTTEAIRLAPTPTSMLGNDISGNGAMHYAKDYPSHGRSASFP